MTLRMPYFSKSKQTWYAWIDGKQRSLSVKGKENEDAAFKVWHRILSGAETPSEASTFNANAIGDAKETLSLGVVLQRFLDDAKQRVGEETYRNYVIFLRPVIAQHGRRHVDETTREAITL